MTNPNQSPNTLLIVDAFSLAFRAFYAYPVSLTLDDGKPINAIFGFFTLLFQAIDQFSPSHVVVCFDRPEPTFRHEVFSGYKAQRTEPPVEFRDQIPVFREMVERLGFCVLEKPGYEADDLLGVCSNLAKQKGVSSLIYTGDQDTFQLVDDMTSVVMHQKGQKALQVFDRAAVIAKVGVGPDQIVDFKALKGDASDNIPGVAGVGDKTAVALLREYGDLDGVYASLDKVTSASVRRKLEVGKENAFLSRQLAGIVVDIDVAYGVEDFELGINWDEVRVFFEAYKFRRLLAKYADRFGGGEEKLVNGGVDVAVLDQQGLEDVLPVLEKGFSFDLVTSSTVVQDAEIDGVGLCVGERVFYLALDSVKDKNESGDVSGVLFDVGQCQQEDVLFVGKTLGTLRSLFENEHVPKSVYGAKFSYQVLKRYGIVLRGVACDVLLGAALVNPLGSVNMPDVVADQLGLTFSSDLGMNAFYIEQLRCSLLPVLDDKGLMSLFVDIEIPVSFVLAEMEYAGVCLDMGSLRDLSQKVGNEKRILHDKIIELAGMSFNLNSPKQLGEVLFDHLGLPVIKKTKTGRSTNVAVLEALEDKHPVVSLVLEYRKLEKLLNTYIDVFPHLVHGRTGRVHTTFQQHVVVTGRLSSVEPNLQNIPIRTERGEAIRRLFVPRKAGRSIVSADYSQIELRLMAHFSGDTHMVEAFKQGQDIHAATAAKLFNCELDQVTSRQRYEAKSVNFGILYGISAFGLSKQLGCSRSEAQDMIDAYFLQFSTVKSFIHSIISRAQDEGCICTAFGRVRPLPNIKLGDKSRREFEERAAVNTFLQGTAAEIMKLAMIDVHRWLVSNPSIDAIMMIQVHDELVLDVNDEDVDVLIEGLKARMEEVVDYSVLLKSNVSCGKNWVS